TYLSEALDDPVWIKTSCQLEDGFGGQTLAGLVNDQARLAWLAVFRFLYEWLDMTAVYTLSTYRNFLQGQDASDIFDLVCDVTALNAVTSDVFLHEVLELSIIERPKELKMF
ncbi:hypothetical protein FOZ62_012733, partial [Perkinsus olseni]